MRVGDAVHFSGSGVQCLAEVIVQVPGFYDGSPIVASVAGRPVGDEVDDRRYAGMTETDQVIVTLIQAIELVGVFW